MGEKARAVSGRVKKKKIKNYECQARLMLSRFVIWLLFALSFHAGMAQARMEIRGRITDSTGTGLVTATVLLIMKREKVPATKDTVSTLSGADGLFHFTGTPEKSFELLVTMKGYLSYRRLYSLSGDSLLKVDKGILQLPSILLQENFQVLEPVTVVQARPVTIRGDTVDYNALAFRLRDGSEVEDLLKRLPGIEVDAQGHVRVQGKKIGRLLVDGKELFGGNLLLAIRNLPSDIVSRIEVVDDYGDKARLTGVKSGEAEKVLNIVLKADKRHEQFGQVEGGGGNEGKYLGHLSGNAFRGDRQMSLDAALSNNSPAGKAINNNLTLGYANHWNKKWEGNGNAVLSQSDNVQQGSTIQDNTFSNGTLHQDQGNQSSSQNENFNAGFTIIHRPDSNSQLRVVPSIAIQDSRQEALSTFSTREQDSNFVKSTTGNTHNQGTNRNFQGGMTGYFEKIAPHSRSRLSISADLQYLQNTPNSDNLSNTTATAGGITGTTLQHYQVTNHNSALTGGANIVYYTPLGKTSFLELNYDWHSSRTVNDNTTRQTDSLHPQPVPIDSLSLNYLFHSVTQQLYAGYIAHSKKFDFSLILEGQPSSLDGVTKGKGVPQRYHYFSFLPLAEVAYTISKEKKLTFNYNGYTSLPSLQQLSPIEDLSNPQYPVTGNPALKPAVNRTFVLGYEQSSLKPTQYYGFGLVVGYATMQQMIITNLVHPRDTGAVIQRTTFLNVNGSKALRGVYHINFPAFWNKHLRISTDGNISQIKVISMVDSILSVASNLNFGQGLHGNFAIPDVFESDLSASYNHTGIRYYSSHQAASQSVSAEWTLNNKHTFLYHWILNYSLSQSYTGSTGQSMQSNPALLNASLQRQFLQKNRASLIFSAYDLLNQHAGVNQSATPTTVTISHTVLTGRYYILSFQLKL